MTTHLPMQPDRTVFRLGQNVIYRGTLYVVESRTLMAGHPAGRYSYRIVSPAGHKAEAFGPDLRTATLVDMKFMQIVEAMVNYLMPRIVLTGQVGADLVQIVECVDLPATDDSPPDRGFLYQAVIGDPQLTPARALTDGLREIGSARGGRLVASSTRSAAHALQVATQILDTAVPTP